MSERAAPALFTPAAPAPTRERLAQAGLLALPAVMVLALCVAPAGLLLQLSVAHRDDGALWSPGFEATQYAQLLDPLFLRVVAFSIATAGLTAAIAVGLAFPAAYFISRMKRRSQTLWLVGLLSTLSLSEVLIVFSFQVLLSGSGGLVKTLVALGLMASPHSLYPNFASVVVGLVYLVLPYMILFLYPAAAQLDDDLPAAAATMGCSPLRAFLTVTLPIVRGPLLSAAALVMVWTVGSYLTPLVLGRPQHWTVGVHISNGAMTTGNLPLAAARAVALVALMGALLALAALLGRRREARP